MRNHLKGIKTHATWRTYLEIRMCAYIQNKRNHISGGNQQSVCSFIKTKHLRMNQKMMPYGSLCVQRRKLAQTDWESDVMVLLNTSEVSVKEIICVHSQMGKKRNLKIS